jgi:hypothetical protein
MRRLALVSIALLALGLVGSARAAEDEEQGEPEEQEAGAVQGWVENTASRFFLGLNGIATAPADVVVLTRDGDEVFPTLPGAAVTGHVVGFGAGVLQASYRVVMGTFDSALCWVPLLPPVSPVPRYKFDRRIHHPDE